MKTLTAALLFAFISISAQLQAGESTEQHIGIITALDSTISKIIQHTENYGTVKIAGRTFQSVRKDDLKLVIVRSPMGKVNNALTTQLLISHFSVDSIVSISPAGALRENIKIGDIVLATNVYQHDFGTWKPYGFIWNKVPVATSDTTHDYITYPDFPDKAVREIAGRLNSLYQGTVLSGDQFIASAEKHDWLQKKFKAEAVDMGAAAIVQVCFSNTIPVFIIRIITDYAGLNARTVFSKSMPDYLTDIDIPQLVFHLIDSTGRFPKHI